MKKTIDTPIKVFSFLGIDTQEKIELTITDILSDVDEYDGIELRGIVNIKVSSYEVLCADYVFLTGVIERLLHDLEKCYDTLSGKAEYKAIYYRELEFTISMGKRGRVWIDGYFQENLSFPNKLIFEFVTDQTMIRNAIKDIRYALELLK